MTNRERWASMVSSVRVGRCAMSMVVLLQVLRRPPYDAVREWCRRDGHRSARPAVDRSPCRVPRRAERGEGGKRVLLLLGVELHDQLLLDRGVDHLTGRDVVLEDTQLRVNDLEPLRARTGAGLRL